MKLIYGTRNPAKVESMERMLEGLDLKLIGLSSLPNSIDIIDPDEIGITPLENSLIKAKTYYQQLKKPLFSCDSALYFENVEPADQPNVAIRRFKGRSLTDSEMIKFYSTLAKKYGGEIIAYYKNGISFIDEEGKIFSYDGDDIGSEKFIIVEKPHKIVKKGFPLDSLSVEISSKRYYYDIENYHNYDNLKIEKGFQHFFKRSIS